MRVSKSRRSMRAVIRSRRYVLSTACCAAALAGARAADAQTTYEWNTAASGNWNVNANWTPTAGAGLTFPVAGDTAIINAAGAHGDKNVFLNGVQSVDTLSFTNTAITNLLNGASGVPVNNQVFNVSGGISVGSGPGTVNIADTASNGNINIVTADGSLNITNNSDNPLSFRAVSSTQVNITGGAAVNVVNVGGTGQTSFVGQIRGGAGTMALVVNSGGTELAGNTSTFSGGVTLNGGRLTVANSNALGSSSSGAITLTLAGGTFQGRGTRTIPGNISMVLAGTATIGSTLFGGITNASDMTWSGNVSFTTAPEINFRTSNHVFLGTLDLGTSVRTFDATVGTTFIGAVSGVGGGVTKTSSGRVMFASTGNTYSGDTRILGGLLAFGTTAIAGKPSPNSRVYIGDGASLELRLSGNATIPSVADDPGDTSGIVVMGNVGACQLDVGDATNFTFSGQFQGSNPANSGGVTKIGSGTWTLAGTNSTFNGYTRLTAGVLEIKSIADGAKVVDVTATNASNTVTVSDATGLQVGMAVNNFGNITPGTTITAIAGNTLTLSAPAVGTTAATSFAGTIGFQNTLGLTPSLASKLLFNGGTLRYIGDGTIANTPGTTDRLFTITNLGGTLDGSGASNAAINFTNTSAAVLTGTGARTFTLTGTSTGANTLAPSLGDGAGGATSVVKNGTGTWIMSGTANTYTGTTTVNDGKLTLASNLLSSSSVTVNAGTLEVAHSGTNDRVVKTGAVTVPAGKIDLKDNKLITTSSVTDVQTLVVSGQGTAGANGPLWDGSGIVTSEAAANNSTATTLAVVSNTQLGKSTFGGQTPGANDTLVMYTWGGDANLSGTLDADDYFQIDSNYGKNPDDDKRYFSGDFNYDDIVDGDDYFIIDGNFGPAQGNPFNAAAPAGLSGVSAVPEPASLGLLGLAAGGLFGRRRRVK